MSCVGRAQRAWEDDLLAVCNVRIYGTAGCRRREVGRVGRGQDSRLYGGLKG
jgi:hypothetical protein